jgi:hypothetical protein
MGSQTYRQNNLARYATHQRNWRAANPKKTLVFAAKSRAKRDGLPFDLSIERLFWPTHCPVLGIELDYTRTATGSRTQRNNFPTLDRRDNRLGYILGNVFVISHRANRIKSDATSDELQAILAYTTTV